ncbi:DMT family transporter [Shouchella lonarensis]|uniref:EamA domain-containing membrane protein RarD n=1 Tax=Shouchella lonarensis TaxID=1464122 RepID=A0A1G6KHF5_9BACI|nr:DMT family transporter [Shouchella lonarensis]SDC30347.1 EamA domain-containing membrane protein RarD [Shouchella lonarensis]
MSIWLRMVLVALFWAGLYPIGHITVDAIHPIVVAFYRFLLTSLCLVPLLMMSKKDSWKIQKQEWVPLLLLGLTGIFLYNGLFFMGLQAAGAVKSAVIIAFIPIVTSILARIFYKDVFTPKKIIGILLSLAGVILVVTEGNLMSIFQLTPGDIWLLSAVVVFSVYALLGKRFMITMSPLKTTTYATVFGTILFVPLVLWIGLPAVTGITMMQWSALLYMAFFATVIAFVWWNKGVAELGPGTTAIFLNLVPVFTLFLSLFFGDTIYWVHVVGTILVFAGVRLTTQQQAAKKASPSPPTSVVGKRNIQ